ncbi:hypothetical protein DPMN_118331 [Dreissena polymorpha]|uniref:Uncharacterized protein n=1 Tax=Dreissena polymorpha TaxID=45954 RepID=A0A9D4GJY2_DREPO|nr:hypothetical protein DPMN_118331 [Dreissena polymorpha]
MSPKTAYTEHKTNEYVRNMTATLVGQQEPLLATGKLAWFDCSTGHTRGRLTGT